MMRRCINSQLDGYQINPLQLNPSAEDMGYGRQQPPQTHADAFFHPLECEPTLQIGYVRFAPFFITPFLVALQFQISPALMPSYELMMLLITVIVNYLMYIVA